MGLSQIKMSDSPPPTPPHAAASLTTTTDNDNAAVNQRGWNVLGSVEDERVIIPEPHVDASC